MSELVPDNPPWIAYYADWSSFAVFPTETQALRYAVEHKMEVARVEWGMARAGIEP